MVGESDRIVEKRWVSYAVTIHVQFLVASSAFVATKPILLVGAAPQSLLHDGIMQLL